MDLNLTPLLTPLLTQLTRNEGAIIALAKMTLTKEQFEVYLIEQQIQANYSWLDIFASFNSMFSESDNFEENIKERIKILEKKRDDLIASQK